MKRKLPFYAAVVIALLSASTSIYAQCRIASDSIIAGESMTRHNTYFYDGANNLIKIERTDSNSVMVNAYDTFYYNVSNQMTKVERYWIGNSTPYYVALLTYTSNLLTNLAAAGDNGSGPWAMTHDFYYNGSNQLTDVILDQGSVVGTPEGLAASFRNMVWAGNNPTYVELAGDLGAGLDTLELSVTYDTKNNLQRLMPLTEAGNAIDHFAANNISQVVFINDEVMGSAGTIALNNLYTYTVDNEVETHHQLPGVFEDRDRTTQYYYENCLTGINNVKEEKTLKVFPNPSSNTITVQSKEKISSIKLFNQVGQEIINTKETTIDVSELPIGVYFIQVNTPSGRTSQRVIVQ